MKKLLFEDPAENPFMDTDVAPNGRSSSDGSVAGLLRRGAASSGVTIEQNQLLEQNES